MRKNGFTLAEVMIVLTVIGILTAILLPAAFQATPDKGLMTFKKANATLGNIIREIVNNDKYTVDGDLSTLSSEDSGKTSWTLCSAFADILNSTSNCPANAAGTVTTPDGVVWNIPEAPAKGGTSELTLTIDGLTDLKYDIRSDGKITNKGNVTTYIQQNVQSK